MRKCVLLILVVLVLGQAAVSHGARILVVPLPWKSNVFLYDEIARGMVERGHTVSMVLSSTYPDKQMFENAAYEVIYHATREKDFLAPVEKDKGALLDVVMATRQIDLFMNSDHFTSVCVNLLSDENTISSLRDRNFDFALLSSVPITRCFVALAYRLELPFAVTTANFEPWLQRVPAIPSAFPFQYAELYSEKMNFMERLGNTWDLLRWTVLSPYKSKVLTKEFIAQFIPDKPVLSVQELLLKTEVWFLEQDILLEYPRPVMPNEVWIGGLLAGPAKPLPSDIQEYMDSAINGVIIVSFGSGDALPKTFLPKFLEAFKTLPYHVLWRSTSLEDPVPPHIKVASWIPQNDVLGHKQTRLFITHSGSNSQMEALYHGVPMLAMPVYADQVYNARKMAYRGYGGMLDLRTCYAHELQDKIEHLITNISYYDNIQKASKIFRSRRETPKDRLLNSIDDVLKYGSSHLRSHALDMPWYEYLMLDILALVTLVLMVGMTLFIFMIRCCMRKCYIHKRKQD